MSGSAFNTVDRPAKAQHVAARLRSLLALLAIVAAVIAVMTGSPRTARAAAVLITVPEPPSLQDHSVLEPTLVARRGKLRKRKRIRRNKVRRHHGKRNLRKLRKLRKSRKHKSHGRKPNKNHGGKPDRNRPGRDKSKNQTADDRTPDHRPPNLICIGGRLVSGRCRCRRAGTRHQIGKSVFGCARPGRALILPTATRHSPEPPRTAAAGPTSQPQATASLPDFVPDEVLMAVAPATAQSVDEAVAQSFGLQILERWNLGVIGARLVRFRIPDGRSVPQVIAAMAGDLRVIAPQPNFYYRAQAASRRELRASDLQYALAKVDATSAHAIANGRGARIAIIDSVIDRTHPDLTGAVEATFDVAGRNTIPSDDHGTAIAGIIRARGLLRGIAPEARLLSIGVYEPTGEKRVAAATTVNLLRGIDWAVTRRANVINMSLAGPADSLLERCVAEAYRRKTVLVAAAGNGGETAAPAYPAAYDNVIAVTATDVADRLYVSANRGGYIAVAAPGVDILAPGLGHAHALQTGTSFAAAHVSGIVALMLERNPALTAEQVRIALTKAAGDLGPPGPDDRFGAGRANAFRSLRLIGQAKQASQ